MKVYRYSLILLIHYFSQGLLVAVLSLLLLDKGLNIGSLALAMGIYAAVAAVLEVPSGIAADRIGRKKIFMIATLVGAASFVIFLIGYGTVAVMAAIGLFGAGRALASGSFEALFIDRYAEAFGCEKLPKAVKILSLCEAAGLAAGALTGGLIPAITAEYLPYIGTYDFNLYFRIVLSAAAVLLTAYLIPADLPLTSAKKISLKAQIAASVKAVSERKNLKLLLLSVISTGFLLCVLESYWQPHFQRLLGAREGQTGLLGVLSLLYFAFVMSGNIAAERLLTKKAISQKTLYVFARVFMAVSAALCAMQKSPLSFAVFYCLIYFFLGAANIAEATMINEQIPGDSRASLLSLQSLIMQGGMLAASVYAKIALAYVPVSYLWFGAAWVGLIFLLPCLQLKEYTPESVQGQTAEIREENRNL